MPIVPLPTWLCWELGFLDLPSSCNFRLKLASREAVWVLGGRREAAVFMFWRLSLAPGQGFNLSLLFRCSWRWPWLPEVTSGLQWMLCWQFTEVATMANNLPYSYGPTPVAIHVSFHSSLEVLTRTWIFCSFNHILQIFIFPALPILEWVFTPIINSFSCNTHSGSTFLIKYVKSYNWSVFSNRTP